MLKYFILVACVIAVDSCSFIKNLDKRQIKKDQDVCLAEIRHVTKNLKEEDINADIENIKNVIKTIAKESEYNINRTVIPLVYYEDSDEIAYSYINKDKIVIAINMLYRYFIGQKDIITIIFASSLPKERTGGYEYGDYSANVWIESHNVSDSNEDLSRFLVKILEKNKWKETAREISSQFSKNKLVVDDTKKTLQFRKAAEKGDGTINYSLKINNIESDE